MTDSMLGFKTRGRWGDLKKWEERGVREKKKDRNVRLGLSVNRLTGKNVIDDHGRTIRENEFQRFVANFLRASVVAVRYTTNESL